MQCATAFNAGTDDDDDVFFFVHLFAIFIVLVLSYCCFLLLFYDRVWNGTFTTFSIITLRCFNEYWARGCRDDANRLSASAVSASHTETNLLFFFLSSQSHFFLFTWCTPISSPSTSLLLQPAACVCVCGGTCCWLRRERMHINTSVHLWRAANETFEQWWG